jgi:putative flippase GtrA
MIDNNDLCHTTLISLNYKKLYKRMIKYFNSDNKGVRFLIAGIFNTGFSYFCGLFLYYSLKSSFHLLLILLITYVITITSSFITYKFFVFKTKGFWLSEYLRFYVLYGAISFFSILFLWFMVSFLLIKFWIAQSCLVLVVAFLSYIGNREFAFNDKS